MEIIPHEMTLIMTIILKKNNVVYGYYYKEKIMAILPILNNVIYNNHGKSIIEPIWALNDNTMKHM